MPTYFNLLVNIQQHPDFVPYAKSLAQEFFSAADYTQDSSYASFTYTPEAFDERMKCIYDSYVSTMDQQTWYDTGIIDQYPVTVGVDYDNAPIVRGKTFNTGSPFSDKVVKESRRQKAPFNLIDGAWLQRIQQAGPTDHVHSHLFGIWDDEAGNGKVEQNHCNVYNDLMMSLGFYFPSINSPEFILSNFLPSGFEQPVFQLCVGLFPDEFFPELLGMTLYLEWEATPTLTPIVRLLEGRNIDPHFYSLHVAIDNITAGHGFLAKEAIKLYLAQQEAEVGKSGVQALWERIWNGYVTWATCGDLGADLVDLALAIDLKQIDLSYPMELTSSTLVDLAGMHSQLTSSNPNLVASFIIGRLRPETKEIITGPLNASSHDQIQAATLAELNLLIQDETSFYSKDRFSGVTLGKDTQNLIDQIPSGELLVKLNRLLLRDAFTGVIADIPKNIPPKPHPDYRAYFRNRMIKLVRSKAYVAGAMHKGKILDGSDLGGLFSRPEDLVAKLEKSDFINVNHPRSSRLLALTEFDGPMYKVFTDYEKTIILDWIESLQEISIPPSQPAPTDPLSASLAMFSMIKEYATAAKSEPSHKGITFPDEAGNPVPLIVWFDNPAGLMAAVKRPPQWVIPGDSKNSILYQKFAGPMAGVLGQDVIKIVGDWIDSGAQLPPSISGDESEMNLASLSINSEIKVPKRDLKMNRFAARRKFIGMGSVH